MNNDDNKLNEQNSNFEDNIQDNQQPESSSYFNDKINEANFNQNANNINENQIENDEVNEYYNRMANNNRIGNFQQSLDNYRNSKNDLEKAKQEYNNPTKQVKNKNSESNEANKPSSIASQNKNNLDRFKDKANVAKSKMGVASNALNVAGAAKDIADDPVEAGKEFAKEKVKEKVKDEGVVLAKKAGSAIINFFASNPFVLIILLAIFFILLLFAILTPIFAEESSSNYHVTIDSNYDFNNVKVEVLSPIEVGYVLDNMEMDSFVKAVAYYYLHNYISDLTYEQKIQMYSASFIFIRSYILSQYGYNNSKNIIDGESFSMTFGDNAILYCSPSAGCYTVEYNGIQILLTNGKVLSEDQTILDEVTNLDYIEPLSGDDLTLFNDCYDDTKYYILVDEYEEEIFKEYDYVTPAINLDLFKYIYNSAKKDKLIKDFIQDNSSLKEYEVYNLALFANLGSGSFGNGIYWYPIETLDSSGLPICKIRYVFGYSIEYFSGTVFHSGVDIPCSVSTPVIASNDGTVIAINDSCPTYGGVVNKNGKLVYSGEGENCTSGNYVHILHADGTKTYYYHLKQGSVKVAKDEEVTKGTVIGEVGSSGMSDGPHLHFQIVDSSGTDQNPQEYISDENPRP